VGQHGLDLAAQLGIVPAGFIDVLPPFDLREVGGLEQDLLQAGEPISFHRASPADQPEPGSWRLF